MLFNSFEFVFLFLPVVLVVWWMRGVPARLRLALLTAASYVFYGYWDWRFTFLMLASTLVDFVAGARIHKAGSRAGRMFWLVFSLVSNLGLLGFFKYSGFLAETVNTLAAWGGSPARIPLFDIVLPVGISFYTFQTMSYTLDIYRGETVPTRDFWKFSAYVSMFPQLVAGPIIRYTEIEAQLAALPTSPSADRMYEGVRFFVLGLCKKVLIADVIGAQIDPLFADPERLQLVGSWMAVLGFTLQIYFDFSGYSDMAVGLGHMMGFQFPQNFDSPYKSANIAEFWRRWHMSLSFWLRDYLYKALGGNRRGGLITLRNLAITMLLGGLWHGAAWTFVVWGMYHGLLLVAHHLLRARGWVPSSAALARALTLFFVVIGWVFFRAESLPMAWGLLGRMFGGFGLEENLAAVPGGLAFMIAATLGWCLFAPNTWELRVKPGGRAALVYASLMLLCTLRLDVERPFVYFQF